jgi:hypothetical protein
MWRALVHDRPPFLMQAGALSVSQPPTPTDRALATPVNYLKSLWFKTELRTLRGKFAARLNLARAAAFQPRGVMQNSGEG